MTSKRGAKKLERDRAEFCREGGGSGKKEKEKKVDPSWATDQCRHGKG